MKFFDGVGHVTTTTGTGTITLGAAIDSSYFTFAEQGAADADEVYYRIDEDGDVEIGIGTLGSSGATLTRDTVLKSRIGGTAGTTKMTLGGAAEVLCIAPSVVMAMAEAAAPAADLDLIFRHGQCRLALDSGSLKLNRFNGRYLVIDGAVETIPSTPPALSASGLTPSTLYYIYAYMNTGTMTLEASTTGHSTDSTTGLEIKTGDATRTLVGMAYCVTGPAWADTDAQRLVASWFNRRRRVAFKRHGSSRSTASGTLVELSSSDRAEFVSWASETTANYTGSVSSDTASRGAFGGVGLDGAAPTQFYAAAYMESTSQDHAISSIYPISGLTEGYHYVTPFGARVGDGSRVWASVGGASILLEI